jgi:hypothetical protein
MEIEGNQQRFARITSIRQQVESSLEHARARPSQLTGSSLLEDFVGPSMIQTATQDGKNLIAFYFICSYIS